MSGSHRTKYHFKIMYVSKRWLWDCTQFIKINFQKVSACIYLSTYFCCPYAPTHDSKFLSDKYSLCRQKKGKTNPFKAPILTQRWASFFKQRTWHGDLPLTSKSIFHSVFFLQMKNTKVRSSGFLEISILSFEKWA